MTATPDFYIRLLRCACLGAILLKLAPEVMAQAPILQPGRARPTRARAQR